MEEKRGRQLRAALPPPLFSCRDIGKEEKMQKHNKLFLMPLLLAMFFLGINCSAVSAERVSLSNSQKELVIEHIREHDPSDMGHVTTNYPAGTKANASNWMVYWSAADAQYYLLYFPPVDYVSSPGGSVEIQCSPFSEPYSCYCFYYKFSDGKLTYFYMQGHCYPEYKESFRKFSVYRLSSFDDIVACNIPLCDEDGLELFDTANNPDGLKPSGGESGGGSGGSEDGSDGGILGFLKGMLEDMRSDIQAIGTGITSLAAGIGDIIQGALKAVFVPHDGFLDEKLALLKATAGTKFGLSSLGEFDSWLEEMDAFKPETKIYFMGHYVDFLSLGIWEGDRSHTFLKLKDFMRVFFYPLLLFGNWKYMVWMIVRGSGKSGGE